MGQPGMKHSYKTTLRENLSLAVYNTGYQKCESGWSWGPAVRDHFLIHYITSGKGTFCCRDQCFQLKQGDLFFAAPSQIVSYTADQEDPWEYFWVGFHGTEAKRLMNLTCFSKETPVLHYKNDDRLKNLLLNIYQHRGNQPINDCQMVGFLYLFLSELIQLSGAVPSSRQPQNSYLERGIRFIQYNFSSNIGVEDIASYVGISRSHLYRIFMENIGLSPNDFLSSYRIQEACSLLRKGGLSINQVAGSVGFSDPLYFSRVFKKHKGVSPSRYCHSFDQKKE